MIRRLCRKIMHMAGYTEIKHDGLLFTNGRRIVGLIRTGEDINVRKVMHDVRGDNAGGHTVRPIQTGKDMNVRKVTHDDDDDDVGIHKYDLPAEYGWWYV